MQEKRQRGSGSKENVGRKKLNKIRFMVYSLPEHKETIKEFAKKLNQ